MTMGEDLSTRVLEFISTVSAAMGLTLEAKVESTPDGPRVDLGGEDGDLLLKHNAEGLLALQHIASAVFRQDLPGKQRVLVDCMGFRRDKDAELRQMAKYLAERARRTGAEQRLGPLNPYERRIVHMAVAEDGTVTSESIGDAFMKTVLISVKKR
jgi:spoIIIJ-associated protein